MNLAHRVASVIDSHQLLSSHDRVIVACSGGADSIALLHILYTIELPLQLFVVYIDHQLRPDETPREIRVIGEYCAALDLEFQVRVVDVQDLVKKEKRSIEESARILRYRALEEARLKFSARVIAVGHTADDQVEEFFIRLLRGSGSKGLSGMKLKREQIIRPLLYENKKDLVGFLQHHKIVWCTDSSNQDRKFLRNRVRLDLLPTLKRDYNPAVDKIVLQNMDVLDQEDKFIEEHVESAYGQCVEETHSTQADHPHGLCIAKNLFLEQHMAIGRRIMEKCCWQMAIRPSFDQIASLIDCIVFGENGKELHLPDGVRAEKSEGHLLLIRPLPTGKNRGSAPAAPKINQMISSPGIYPIAGTNRELVVEIIHGGITKEITDGRKTGPSQARLLVDLAKIDFPLQLRSSQPGERFTPFGREGSKKISRYLNEKKVPARERSQWPLLLTGKRVVALVGIEINHSFRLVENTQEMLSIEWRERKPQSLMNS